MFMNRFFSFCAIATILAGCGGGGITSSNNWGAEYGNDVAGTPSSMQYGNFSATDGNMHRVAVLLPLSGQNASAGKTIRTSVEMAVLQSAPQNLSVTFFDTARSDAFENAADVMVQSMLRDPAFASISPSNRKVIAIGRIVNDTPQRIDTDKLISKITIALRKSGKFVLTTAVAAGGARDSMSKDVRELRDDDEFNQATIAKKGTLISPDFSLAGKIRQDNVKLPNGKIQAEYFFYLSVTDLTSGLAYWEDEQTINKTGDKKSVTW